MITNSFLNQLKWIVGCLILVSGFCSCKKTELTVSDVLPNSFKVYYDTTGDVTSYTMDIASGNNRLYLTYGHGGIFSISTNYDSKILVTDRNGNLLNEAAIKNGFQVTDLMTMDDGSLVATAAVAGYTNDTKLLIYHFTMDGDLISLDSIMPVFTDSLITFTGYDVKGTRMCKSQHAGNFIIFGRSWDQTGYVLEYNFNSGIVWSTIVDQQVGDCLPTNDGGYLLSACNFYFNYSSLIKMNAIGDTLWTKHFVGIYPLAQHLISTDDNNYLVGNGYFNPITNHLDLSIYKVTPQGDSIGAYKVMKQQEVYLLALLMRSNGEVFALTNKNFYGGFMPESYFNQYNTPYYLISADLQQAKSGYFQTSTTDDFGCSCLTDDGHIACFGMIQPYHKKYYQPVLTIIE